MESQALKRSAGLISLGLRWLLGSRAGNRLGILVYHRIAPSVPGVPPPSINVTPERFHAQLAGLLRLGYRPYPLEHVLEAGRAGRPLPPRVFVVTFDDGHATVATHAWPILRDLQVPATIFVNTAFLDSPAPFPFDVWGCAHQSALRAELYRPLTTAECRQLQASGLVTLGAHTHTHGDFRGQPEALRRDLETCVAELHARFGLNAPTFAFPFGRRAAGYVSPELLAAAREAGVCCALTTEADLVTPHSDPFGWGRFNAYDWDTASTLAARLEGWYGWAPRLQEALAGYARRKQPSRSAARCAAESA